MHRVLIISFYSVGIPAEVVAAQLLTTYWDKDLSHAPIYIAVIGIALVSINLFGVRWV